MIDAPRPQFPLPVAALVRRARNAKSAKERHDLVYFAWEASIRIAVAVAPPADASSLVVPSVGSWIGALRAQDRILDAPSLLHLYGAVTEVAFGARASARGITRGTLLGPFAAYRNQVIGHGAVRPAEFYEALAPILLEGLDAAWSSHLFLPPGGALAYVDTVERGGDGGLRARVLDLTGFASAARHLPIPTKGPDIVPGRVHVVEGDGLRPLYPWLLYRETDLREQVLFFNGRRRAAKYLDFVSGEELKGAALTEAFPTADDDVARALSAPPAAEPESTEQDPSAFGDYRILGKLGEGGMGEVFLAVQRSLGRVVALKTLPEAAAYDAVAVARFRREIAALSRCDHPNVVKIYASGAVDGKHYYAMEFIDGADLADVARTLPTSHGFDAAVSSAVDRAKEARAETFRQVPQVHRATSRRGAGVVGGEGPIRALAAAFLEAARGVQHLHEMGIVHRDIKPGNLMLTAEEHRLVVMDLGLAALGDASRALTKDAGAVLGTVRYMPPEQIERALERVDHRADIYALGATFYELLAGRPIFDGDGEARLINQVLHEAPLAPRKANPLLPIDLATIVEKCLQKDPHRRYDTADALARDLAAFLEGRPIVARPPTLGYVLALAIRRNRALTALALGAVMVVLALVGGFVSREHELRRAAEAERAAAEASRADSRDRLGELLTEKGRQELVVSDDAARALAYLWAAYDSGYTSPTLTFLLAEALRPFEGDVIRLESTGGPVKSAQFSPGGARVATATEDGAIRLWDASTGALLGALDGAHGGLRSLRFADRGKGILRMWADGAADYTDQLARTFALAPDGIAVVGVEVKSSRAAIVLSDATARLWDLASGTFEPIRDPSGAVKVLKLRGSEQQGDAVLEAGADGSVHIWTGHPIRLEATLPGEGVALRDLTDIAVDRFTSKERPLVVTLDAAATVRVWEVGSRRVLASFPSFWSASRLDVEPGKEGPSLSIRVRGVGIQVFRVTETKGTWAVELEETLPVDAESKSANTGRDAHVDGSMGRRATITADGRVELFDPRRSEILPSSHDSTQEFERLVEAWNPCPRRTQSTVAFSPDGAFLVINCELDKGSSSLLHEAHTGRFIRSTGDPLGAVRAFSPDGHSIITEGGQVEDIRPERRAFTLEGVSSLTHARVSSTGGLVLGLGPDLAGGQLWSAKTGKKTLTLVGGASQQVGAAFSPSGDTVMTCGGYGARIWDSQTGGLVAKLVGHRASVLSCAFAPSGDAIMTTSADDTAKLWDPKTGRLLLSLEGHTNTVTSAAFSPDGARLATASLDGDAKLWDARTGELLASMPGGGGALWIVRFTHNGALLLTAASEGRSLRIWDGVHGRLLAKLASDVRSKSDGPWVGFYDVDIDPRGERIVTSEMSTGRSPSVRLWDIGATARSRAGIKAIIDRAVPWTCVDGDLRRRRVGDDR